jgi:hypothetical protein
VQIAAARPPASFDRRFSSGRRPPGRRWKSACVQKHRRSRFELRYLASLVTPAARRAAAAAAAPAGASPEAAAGAAAVALCV